MGMLIRRHRDRHKTEGDQAPAEGPYADLTDEQVAEAYATNVGGRARTRAGQEKALAELDAEDGGPDKAPDLEADKEPDTEPDPGAGGDNPDAPAPDDSDESDEDDDPDA